MTSRALVILTVLAFALSLPAQAADPKGELRVAIPWTPENLDPTMNLSSIRSQVGVSMFDSLVGRSAENRIVPELAESWKLVDDHTWQFKLRKGVLFHNGEPFNADSVRFTIQRVLDPAQKSPNRANIAEITRVEVLDDFTVNLVTRQPYAPLLNRLIDFPILPPQVHSRAGEPALRSPAGWDRALQVRGAGQGRAPDRRGLRPTLARRPHDSQDYLQARPGAVHPGRVVA